MNENEILTNTHQEDGVNKEPNNIESLIRNIKK